MSFYSHFILGYYYLFIISIIMHASYKYPDGSEYNGEWNDNGQRHGFGTMTFPDGTRYTGNFENGLCQGYGVMLLADGSR